MTEYWSTIDLDNMHSCSLLYLILKFCKNFVILYPVLKFCEIFEILYPLLKFCENFEILYHVLKSLWNFLKFLKFCTVFWSRCEIFEILYPVLKFCKIFERISTQIKARGWVAASRLEWQYAITLYTVKTRFSGKNSL